MLQKTGVKQIAYVVIGVMLSGYIMNAMRSNSVVNYAISGYDA